MPIVVSLTKSRLSLEGAFVVFLTLLHLSIHSERRSFVRGERGSDAPRERAPALPERMLSSSYTGRAQHDASLSLAWLRR